MLAWCSHDRQLMIGLGIERVTVSSPASGRSTLYTRIAVGSPGMPEESEWEQVPVATLAVGDHVRYHEFEGVVSSLAPTVDPDRLVVVVATPAGEEDSLQLDADWQVLRLAAPASGENSSTA